MAYIFTPGQCTKAQLYDVVLNAMLAAGWQNITSNYATDGDVLYSTGVNGDKSLIINLIPYSGRNASGITASAANDAAYSTRTTTYAYWSFRLEQSYTPGASGTAGTFSHPSRTFNNPIYLFAGLGPGSNWGATYYAGNITFPIDTVMNYYIYVDKSKLILFVKPPDTYSINWSVIYIGLPDTTFAKCDNGRGVICALNWNWWGAFPLMTEYPDDGVVAQLTGTNNYYTALTFVQPTTSPNQNGKYFLSEIYYHNSSYGLIGKLDGILGVSNNGLTTGDTITIAGITYTIINIQTPCAVYNVNGGSWVGPSNSFGFTALAVRLS